MISMIAMIAESPLEDISDHGLNFGQYFKVKMWGRDGGAAVKGVLVLEMKY